MPTSLRQWAQYILREPAFVDARGAITDILDGVPLNAVTIITNKKGAVRGATDVGVIIERGKA